MLEADGWVSASPSDKKTGSVVYALRPAGRKALVAWTHESDAHATARDPFLVRLRAMANVADADPETALLRARTRHLARLQHYEALHRKHFGPIGQGAGLDTGQPVAGHAGEAAAPQPAPAPMAAPLTRADLLRQLVLDAGLRRERSQLDWCDASLQALRAWAAQSAAQAPVQSAAPDPANAEGLGDPNESSVASSARSARQPSRAKSTPATNAAAKPGH